MGYKTEWHFEGDYGPDKILLKADEDSPEDEIEDEIEYWMDQVRSYDLQGKTKAGIMAAIKWLTMLLSV